MKFLENLVRSCQNIQDSFDLANIIKIRIIIENLKDCYQDFSDCSKKTDYQDSFQDHKFIRITMEPSIWGHLVNFVTIADS